MNLPILDISCKYNHIICGFVCRFLRTMFSRFIYLYYSMYQYLIPFCCSIICHHVNIKHLVYLFIRLKDIWFVSTFHLWWMLGTLAHKILCGHMFSILLGIHVGMELMDHMVIPFLTISWTIKLFSREAAPLHFSTSYTWGLCLCPCQYLLQFTCFLTSLLLSVVIHSLPGACCASTQFVAFAKNAQS